MNLSIKELDNKLEEAIEAKGKLLMIQELSNWLLDQPISIYKEELIEFMLAKAGELEDGAE